MRSIRNLSRPTSLLLSLLGLAVLLAGLSGCAPSSSSSSNDDPKQSTSASRSSDRPELTDELIRERVNYTSVRDVPEENGSGEPIHYWTFSEDEPKEITIVEKQIEANRATIVLDIKTGSAPRSRNRLALAGQIRTEWVLRTGWV